MTEGQDGERPRRGRPIGSGLRRSNPALQAAIWRLVRREIANGSPSIVKACRSVLARHRISISQPNGVTTTVLFDGKEETLRRWYQAAEHERKANPDSQFARQCQDWLNDLNSSAVEQAGLMALMNSLREDSKAGKSHWNGNYPEMMDKAERARAKARAAALARGVKAPKTPRKA